jgi:hypothetical protein
MNFMPNFVRLCAIYNVSGALTLLSPPALEKVGFPLPSAEIWAWLPALIGTFAAIVLWLASRDLAKYGAFIYWNAVVRLTFVVLTFALDFAATAGSFATVLALGDLALAAVILAGLPRATGRSALALLADR